PGAALAVRARPITSRPGSARRILSSRSVSLWELPTTKTLITEICPIKRASIECRIFVFWTRTLSCPGCSAESLYRSYQVVLIESAFHHIGVRACVHAPAFVVVALKCRNQNDG